MFASGHDKKFAKVAIMGHDKAFKFASLGAVGAAGGKAGGIAAKKGFAAAKGAAGFKKGKKGFKKGFAGIIDLNCIWLLSFIIILISILAAGGAKGAFKKGGFAKGAFQKGGAFGAKEGIKKAVGGGGLF